MEKSGIICKKSAVNEKYVKKLELLSPYYHNDIDDNNNTPAIIAVA